MKFCMLTFCLAVCSFANSIVAQDPLRFAGQIEQYQAENTDWSTSDLRPIVFTGSSSVRMWKDLDQRFPGQPVVNRGFGGSQMSDLLYYIDELVLSLNPKQVFIYEGDNDIAAGKSTDEIMSDTRKVTMAIKEVLPDIEIILIAAKPSVARWSMAERYLELNDAFSIYAASIPGIRYADVWTPALTPDGLVRSDIFLQDNLHMNAKGYDIWTRVLQHFLMN